MSVNLSELSGELTLDDIEAVLSGGREKGQYKADAIAFIESGKMGVPYNFSGKKGQSVKTGFESALTAIQKDDSNSEETRNAARDMVVKLKKQGEGDAATELIFLVRGDLVRAAKNG